MSDRSGKHSGTSAIAGLFLFVFLAVAYAAPTTAPTSRHAHNAEKPVFLSGSITDADGKAPIAGAEVSIFDPRSVHPPIVITTARSDADGDFIMPQKLPSGSYVIRVYLNHQYIVSQSLDASAGGALNIHLCAASASIKGTVVDARGKPVANVSVSLAESIQQLTYHARTDEKGHYEIDHVIAGHYLALAVLGGPRQGATYQIDVERNLAVESKPVEKNFTLQTKRTRHHSPHQPTGGSILD